MDKKAKAKGRYKVSPSKVKSLTKDLREASARLIKKDPPAGRSLVLAGRVIEELADSLRKAEEARRRWQASRDRLAALCEEKKSPRPAPCLPGDPCAPEDLPGGLAIDREWLK